MAIGLGAIGLNVSAQGFAEISFPTADGGTVYGNLYGEGLHAVLLAHGAVFDKESWDGLAQFLSAEGYQVLAIDFRGYGKSTAGSARSPASNTVVRRSTANSGAAPAAGTASPVTASLPRGAHRRPHGASRRSRRRSRPLRPPRRSAA